MPWKCTRIVTLGRCYRERTEAAFHRRFSTELLLHRGVGRTVQHLPYTVPASYGKTAHKWINHYKEYSQSGLEERSRRPHSCPWQTPSAVVEEHVSLRKAHPRWGPKKLLDVMGCRDPDCTLPAISTTAKILAEKGLVKPRRRYQRAHPGCPQTTATEPNDIWPADYKGQFRLKNSLYCFPLTVSDLATRFILGVDGHPTISLEHTVAYFRRLFTEYGLPKHIRTDNGVPFASNALARLSQLSVWFTPALAAQVQVSSWVSIRS